MQDTTTHCKMLDATSVIWWITRVESINNAPVSQNGKLLRNEETIIEMQRGKSVLFLIMLRKTVTEQTRLTVCREFYHRAFPQGNVRLRWE